MQCSDEELVEAEGQEAAVGAAWGAPGRAPALAATVCALTAVTGSPTRRDSPAIG